jgi:hypothetical protein
MFLMAVKEKKDVRLIALIEKSLMKAIQAEAKKEKVSVATIVRRKLKK